jgi:acetyl-CoA carboxylase carboxyltransferase component
MTMAPPTSIDPRSDHFAGNREAMQVLLDDVRAAQEQVLEGHGEQGRQRHRDRGRLLPRERLDLLLDRDSPFLELSALAGWGTDDPLGGGLVLGIGIIEDVECLVVADDLTEPGRTVSPTTVIKARRGHELALRNRLPLVNLVEPTDPDRSAAVLDLVPAGTTFKELALLSASGIPTVTVVFGAPAPNRTDVPTLSDHTIFVPDPAQPAHAHSWAHGLAAEVALDDVDGLRLARQGVRNLNWRKGGPGPTQPATAPLLDADELLAIPSAEPRLPFEVREVIWRIVDRSRFDEFRPRFGTQLVTGWASLCGFPVGIVANNGALQGDEVRKGDDFTQLCNARGIPIVFLQNIPGPDSDARPEWGGIVKHGAELINVVASATVPHLVVMIGASYGTDTMASRAQEPRFVFTWPNHHVAVSGAHHATGRQWDDGIIDPRDTRVVLGIALSCIHSAPFGTA